MAEPPPSWKLSPSQRLSIFTNQILPNELLPHINNNNQPPSNTTPQPQAIIILGQTGAGKTRLAPALLSSLQKATTTTPSPIAHLIADTYKTYHPHYTTCLTQFPLQASRLAGPDARAWLTMSVAHAASHHLPVLLESACRHPTDFTQLVSIFHTAGYRVLVAILAVPAPISRLGILVRYYRDLPEARSRGLPVRLTPRVVHDESYAGLEEAARFVDEGGAVDEVVVVRRGGMVAYMNKNKNRRGVEGGDGGWKKDAGALRALMGERERGVLVDEREVARRDIDGLRKLGDRRVDELVGEIEGEIAGLGRGDGVFPDLELLDVDGIVGRQLG